MTKRVKFWTAALAALTMGGALSLPSTPAEAQVYYQRGFYPGGGYYGPGFHARPAPVRYYGHRWGGGYRPYRPVGHWGPRYRGYYPYGYYRRSYDNGGAVAAGLIGGLALGAIMNAAARPAYYAPVARNCFLERRRIVNRYGRVVIRRVRTCY